MSVIVLVNCFTRSLQHKMVVILAGYPDKMAAMFTKNTGLKSRFAESLQFEDWTGEQLSQLVIANLKKSTPVYTFDDEAAVERALTSGFNRIRINDPLSWANARDGHTMQDLIKGAFVERAAQSRLSKAGGRDPNASSPPVTGIRLRICYLSNVVFFHIMSGF
jgi:hypothetical protein